MNRILFGDCRTSLAELAAQGVKAQMCVTSPPYYGLRDYGTGTWEGGSTDCDHVVGEMRLGLGLAASAASTRGGAHKVAKTPGITARALCPKCGARRIDSQIGLEETPEQYIAAMVEVFRAVREVLADDGTLWVNIGDSYNNNPSTSLIPRAEQGMGSGVFCLPSETQVQQRRARPNKAQPLIDAGIKKKDLIGIPWMLAFALRADGWYLRQDIIWHKPNPMPESVTDRCTKAHEYMFLLSKSPRYYFDHEAIKEPALQPKGEAKQSGQKKVFANQNGGQQSSSLGSNQGTETRNRRSVWSIATRPYKGAHFAVFPPALVEPCILAGSRPAGKRCDCEEVIGSPTGSVAFDDPSQSVGRAGMSRPRGEHEGKRSITKREQRHHAHQLKTSPHRSDIEARCGDAFAHYIRTDNSGARPLPEALRREFMSAGWITASTPCDCPVLPADIVLDPFMGSGTTAAVAVEHGRGYIGCELNATYEPLQQARITAASAKSVAPEQSDLFAQKVCA